MFTKRVICCVMAVTEALLALSLTAPARAYSPPAEEGNVTVDKVQLHYKLQGTGDAIVFVHGIASNYQVWDSYVAAFANNYQVISYSRRYNWPNHNKFAVPVDPLAKEVDDLYWLIRAKDLGRVHLVGESYGALIALSFAVQHPDMVRTMTLVEPPLARWLLDSPATSDEWRSFLNGAYIPAKGAILEGRTEPALQTFEDWLEPGYFSHIPPQDVDIVARSVDDLKAVLLATGGYPTISHADLNKLNVPVLLISGEKSAATFAGIEKQLAMDLGGTPVVTIADAGNNVVSEQPAAVRSAIGEFLSQHARR